MNYLRTLFGDKSKKTVLNIGIVLILGLLLLLLSNGMFFNNESENTQSLLNSEAQSISSESKVQSYEAELERRMEEALKLAAGVGNVKVMINISTGREIVVAEDTSLDESITKEVDAQGGTREQTSKRIEDRNIIINERDGTQTPLVLKEIQPKIEGLIIIAEGGDDIFVRDALTRAAQALFAVEANKVTVLKMKI